MAKATTQIPMPIPAVMVNFQKEDPLSRGFFVEGAEGAMTAPYKCRVPPRIWDHCTMVRYGYRLPKELIGR